MSSGAEQYNRKQADLVSIQGEIARDVVVKLIDRKLSAPEEQKRNYIKANPAGLPKRFLQAVYLLERSGSIRAAEAKRSDYFQQAYRYRSKLCVALLGRYRPIAISPSRQVIHGFPSPRVLTILVQPPRNGSGDR